MDVGGRLDMDTLDFGEMTLVDDPPAALSVKVMPRRRLRPATDLLADFLVAYGDGRDVEPLPEHVMHAYLHDGRPPVRRHNTPGVFSSLIPGGSLPDFSGEVV